MAFIRSISGIRATLGDDLTPSMVAEYTSAFAAFLPQGIIVVGRDGRPSGNWIEQIVTATLSACGRSVLVLGMVPTPTVQLFAEREGVAGGISITASHNPAQWNGLKFLNQNGLFLDAGENEQFWKIADQQAFSFVSQQQGGECTIITDAGMQHIQSIMALPPLRQPDLLSNIQNQHFRVVVDAVNCSGSQVVPTLLSVLGCEVIPIFCDGSGIFPHTPEPLPEHLGELSRAVREHKADLGIAVDPDADRLVLIDEQGVPVREENTIVLAVLSALRHRALFNTPNPATVVINLSTTQAVEDVAAGFGATVYRSAVGEINVVQTMLRHNALIGGEGSGGVIVSACHAGRDSLVGIALTLLLLAKEKAQNAGQTLSGIIAELPHYAMVKKKKEFSGTAEHIFTRVMEHFPEAMVNRDDGLRLTFGSSWLHLRTSNTEPIIRVIAEAPSLDEAESLAHQCLSRL